VVSAALLAADPPDRAAPPFEVPSADPAAKKVVFIAGSNASKPGEHEYVAGCAVLADLLRQSPGIAPVLAADWPKKPETLAGARALVFFFDGGAKHAVLTGDRAAHVQRLMDAGVGLVQLHQAADYPKDFGDRARGWTGAAWEAGYSKRAHWVAEFKEFPDHPAFRGVTPFRIDDGWLYRLRFVRDMAGVTPLLRTSRPGEASPPAGSETVVGWAYERPGGGRSFTFTGSHLHRSLAEPGYRRFLVNGILWAAGVDIPAGGAPVALSDDSLNKYLAPSPANRRP
jgi:hypothetical protein